MTLPIRAYENDETFCFDANQKSKNQQKKLKSAFLKRSGTKKSDIEYNC